jgi:hypothetical protein
MRTGFRTILSILLALAACSGRQAGGREDDEGPTGVPEWSPCVSHGDPDTETCADVCATMGTTCVANGCDAVADYCDPEPCDMATQALALDAEASCADASVGGFVASTCEEPIHWLFSNTLRCCCAEGE